jgi:SAM-dependent methyltransferase
MAANLVGPRLSRRIAAAWYPGRRVLDAGCGHGRYLRAFAALGADVVGLDVNLTPGALAAARSTPRVHLVEGSVLEPPFAAASFDLVFCDGVLHHTSGPAAGYQALARLVRPGGALYVWLYPREGRAREALFGAARAVTTRLPGGVVRWLAFVLAPLTLLVRSYSGTRFGRATWAECAQVVHDWIAPPLQSHHDAAEVSAWARAAGLGDLEVLPVPTGLTAWRPPAKAHADSA